MASRYLLDTNILSELCRNPQGAVTEAIKKVGEQRICTSIIVAAELRFGAAKSGARKLSNQLSQILGAIQVLPLGEPSDREYAKLRKHLEKTGRIIGPNDMLIAAHALAEDCTLVTANEREFSRVPSLKTENWLAG